MPIGSLSTWIMFAINPVVPDVAPGDVIAKLPTCAPEQGEPIEQDFSRISKRRSFRR